MTVSLSKDKPPEMSPQDVTRIREGLGLSQAGLARLLRMGSGSARTVRSWEAGEVERIPGPVQVALEALEAGWAPGVAFGSEQALMTKLVRAVERLEELEELSRIALAEVRRGR